MGGRESPLLHHPPRDVSTCCRAGTERGGVNDLPGLLTWPSEVGPTGRCLCYSISGIPD